MIPILALLLGTFAVVLVVERWRGRGAEQVLALDGLRLPRCS